MPWGSLKRHVLSILSIESRATGLLVVDEASLAADGSGVELLVSGTPITSSFVADSVPVSAKASWTGAIVFKLPSIRDWLDSVIGSSSLAISAEGASGSNCCWSISQGDSPGLAVTAPPATGSDSACSVRPGVERSSMYWFALCMSSMGTSDMTWATAALESMQKSATVDTTTATSLQALSIGPPSRQGDSPR